MVHRTLEDGLTIMQTVTLEQLRATTDAGGVLGVTLQADGPAFLVKIETRRGDRLLVTTRHEPRKFVDPRKAMLLLRDMGICDMRIDGAKWRPEEVCQEKKARPDRAVAMKKAHEAAAHVQWMREQVETAIKRADSEKSAWADSGQVDAWLATWGQDNETQAPPCS
jgi:hypothetical protein